MHEVKINCMFCVIGKALLLFPQLYMLPSKELAFEAVGIFGMAHAKTELSQKRSFHCFLSSHAVNLRRDACVAIALAFSGLGFIYVHALRVHQERRLCPDDVSAQVRIRKRF